MTWKKIKKKLQSPVVWVLIVTNIISIIEVFNPKLSGQIKAVWISVQEILNIFGFLNNPDERKNF